MPKLFKVISKVDGVIYETEKYNNVIFNWFIIERAELQIPGEEAIINYKNLPEQYKKNAESYIKELFTEKESIELKALLESTSKGDVIIEEILLPITDNMKGYSSLSIGEGRGFTDLYRRKNYNLGFKVRGFFNINSAEKSFTPDERPTVIAKFNPEDLKKDD